MPDAKPVQYRIVELAAGEAADERADVIAGLLGEPARIAPKYFYDEQGCALYGAICELQEYYPTRTEAALFREHRAEIARAIGPGRQFVDLGAGDCCKGEAWLPFVEPARYVAVDIAAGALGKALARMAPEHPALEMLGVATDFSAGVAIGEVLDERPVAFFYPGSSIGNFTPTEALGFLRSILAHCEGRGGGLLIGVDGKKDKAILDAAYDDALGVTAAFNRNVLRHLNRRFGFDFVVANFAHRGFYEEARGRIEMHLEAIREQRVDLGSRVRRFAAGERIHTESSYKYAAAEFESLLREAGFGAVRRWSHPATAYHVFHAAA